MTTKSCLLALTVKSALLQHHREEAFYLCSIGQHRLHAFVAQYCCELLASSVTKRTSYPSDNKSHLFGCAML
jgi:hypothetical protein